MSLILEALKKSEANRRLGEAPDLATPFATRPKRRSPLPVLFVLIAIAATAGWWLLRAPPPGTDANVAAAPPAKVPAPAHQQAVPTAPATAPAAAPAAPAAPIQGAPQNAVTDQNPGGGFIAMPQPWSPNKPTRDAAGVATNTPAQGKPAATAPPQAAGPAAVATASGAGQKKAEPAAATPSAPPPAPASVVAGGAGQKKAEPAAAAATALQPPPAAMVASGAGQKKAEPAPADNKPVFVASGGGQKKSEPAAPATPAVASDAGQKKPEPAAANAAPQPAPGSVVASGGGQKKAEGNNVQNAANAAAAPPSAPPYNELTFATRKDLPQLKLSMHVYAAEPLQRFVILNNARLTEGDKQDDLAVREIRPDGVVLEFRGQRFFYPRDGI